MVEILQEYIKNWLSAKRHRSLKQLAEECGLNYGTVRNMADGKAVPNGETILRVLLATTNVEEMHAFVQEHLPHLTPYTKALTDYGTRITRPFVMTRRHCEVLLEVAFCPSSEEKLREKFGPSIPNVLEELTSAEIIFLERGAYRITSRQAYVPSQQMAVELSRVVLDNVDINLRGNLILAQGAGLSIEATREIYTIMEKAQNEALKVLKDPTNQGENRVAISLAMTLF